MDNLPIVLVVVAVVALLVYFLFFRKKALPEAGKAAPGTGAAITPSKEAAKAADP